MFKGPGVGVICWEEGGREKDKCQEGSGWGMIFSTDMAPLQWREGMLFMTPGDPGDLGGGAALTPTPIAHGKVIADSCLTLFPVY